MWPPSSTGMGIRFNSPRFKLMEASRPSSGMMPACADSPDSDAMPTGPISCRGDVSPVKSPPNVRKISTAVSQF